MTASPRDKVDWYRLRHIASTDCAWAHSVRANSHIVDAFHAHETNTIAYMFSRPNWHKPQLRRTYLAAGMNTLFSVAGLVGISDVDTLRLHNVLTLVLCSGVSKLGIHDRRLVLTTLRAVRGYLLDHRLRDQCTD